MCVRTLFIRFSLNSFVFDLTYMRARYTASIAQNVELQCKLKMVHNCAPHKCLILVCLFFFFHFTITRIYVRLYPLTLIVWCCAPL